MASGLAHHVSGESAIVVGLGSAGALIVLGYSVDGVDIEFRENVDPVMDDRFGPRVPADEQDFLIDGTVRADVVFWDDAVRNTMMIRAWNGTTEGVMPGSGRLFGAGSLYYRLLINVPTISPSSETPWNFLSSRLLNASSIKVGTVRSIWRFSWYFKGYIGTNTSTSGGTVFNRSAA